MEKHWIDAEMPRHLKTSTHQVKNSHPRTSPPEAGISVDVLLIDDTLRSVKPGTALPSYSKLPCVLNVDN